ncbi:MAG: gluconeogenesis factor YvcK family protein, partial [Bacillota bacterium]
MNWNNLGKWLYPGIKMKRWIFLIILGLILTFSGIALLFEIHFIEFMEKIINLLNNYVVGPESSILYIIIAFIILVLGIYLTFWSFHKIEERLSEEFLSNQQIIDVLYENSLLQKGPDIVSLGGGTGLSNLLRGLKKLSSNITAVVTVADDGGSSGKLRDELDILPPGDIRNCLVALADTEPLMEKLMQYRFSDEGH